MPVLCAAVVGTPIIAIDQGIAGTLLKDGEHAFLCPSNSPPCIGEKVNRLMNENVLRKQFSRYARDIVINRVKQDYGSYISRYRDSIERCVVSLRD